MTVIQHLVHSDLIVSHMIIVLLGKKQLRKAPTDLILF